MSNSLLPIEAQNQPTEQVEMQDKRRDLGHAFLVIAGQLVFIAVVMLLWMRYELNYSQGLAHPIAYYFAIVLPVIAIFGAVGFLLRRGTPCLQ
jgi:nitrate reductase gamma subunit